MSTSGKENRARAIALDDLIRLRIPTQDALSRLRAYQWDAAPDLAVLTPDMAIKVLDRYISGELSATQVADRANAIEGREDIAFPPLFESVLTELIFELANPEISRPLTAERASDWSGRLRSEL